MAVEMERHLLGELLQLAQIVMVACAAVAASCAALMAVWLLLRLRTTRRRLEGKLYAIAAPAESGASEQVFLSLHGLLRPALERLLLGQPWVSLEIVGRAGRVQFHVWLPSAEKAVLESVLRASYPGLELVPAEEPRATTQHRGVAHGHLSRGSLLPIRTTFEGEPLSTLLWTLARVRAGEEIALQLLVRPKPSRWQVRAQREAERLREGRRGWIAILPGVPAQVTPTQADKDRAKAIGEKSADVGLDCVLRVAAAADRRETVREYVRAMAVALAPYTGANSLALGGVSFRRRAAEVFEERRFPTGGEFILTARELAAVWHLPSDAPPHLAVNRAPKLRPPETASQGDRLLGLSTWGDEKRAIGLSIPDSRLHLHLLGPTGTGKTTAMLNLAVQDVAAGRGVGILDPKGDLVRGVLERIPRSRLDDVVLISPEESDSSVGINPLELWPGDDRELVAENALTIFKRLYERFWGPRTDDILKAALLTLVRRADSTLAHIPLLLTSRAFRQRALKGVRDPLGLDGFWRWFERLTESQRAEAIGPVMNKLRDFLVRTRLRRLLCQPRSTVDLREVLDSGRILLADLSVGRWGESTAGLVGSFLVAKIWQAALARDATPEERRRDFFLYLDEFQHFQGIGGPFADALAEARSLRLCLTIANQHLGQLPRDLREAIGSNARSRAVFQCGQDDATYLAREFAPLDARALMSLPRFEMAVRLSFGGLVSSTFTLRTQPPAEVREPHVADAARVRSKSRFGRPVDGIDRELEATLRTLSGTKPPDLGIGRGAEE